MATTNLTLYGENSRQIKPAVVNLFQANNNVDSLEFQMENYQQGNVDLSTLDPYAICYGSEFLDGLDEVKLTSEVTEDGILRIYWDLTIMSLSVPQTITYQLVFKSDAGEVWTSYKGILFCNESLTADEEIVAKYPTILKQMETRIDTKTDEATQGAVEEITNNVATQMNDAVDRVNQMAEDFDAAVVYIPYGETIPVYERVNNRLYYQYTNADNTKGRFEDWLGHVLVSESTGGGGGLPMFAPIWSDHLYNDASYLRADNFSWHYADVYVTAYDKLLEEYNNENCVEETENGVTYKRSPNGFKIADVSQHDEVLAAYNNTGVAWYYIIDTDNKRFKLPRTQWGFVGLRDIAGGYIEAGLPENTHSHTWGGTTSSDGNHTHTRGTMEIKGTATANGSTVGFARDVGTFTGAFYNSKTIDQTLSVSSGGNGATLAFQASRNWTGATSSDGAHTHTVQGVTSSTIVADGIYGNSDTVQPPATQMYLYFYVGNYERPATEVNIGILTELANGTDLEVIVEEINTEVDTIKTQAIAEIEATGLGDLQAQVDSLSEQVVALQAEINTMMGRMDFANSEEFRVNKDTTYTCPSDGYVQFMFIDNANYAVTVNVNGKKFANGWSVGNGLTSMFPVSAGDVISVESTVSGTIEAVFIPQK